MTSGTTCASCAYEAEQGVAVDDSQSNVAWAEQIGCDESSIRRHKAHREAQVPLTPEGVVTASGGDTATGEKQYTITADRAFGYEDFRKFIEQSGQNPDEVHFNWGVTTNPHGGFWNKLLNVREKGADGGPAWPVIQQAQPVAIENLYPATHWTPRDGLKMSLKGADTQIGFRILADGTLEAFHDDRAMDVFIEVARQEQPEEIVILGDFLDLPSQSRWAQEAGFARTTQPALDAAHLFLAKLRKAAPLAKIVIIEGNHDKRMQNFIETNALAAFGLKRANMPDDWPTLSLPFLLRLDELDIEYKDAYPAAVYWDDDRTRNIHGTRANSKGSTTAQYANDLPHINTWAGHTHRAEITYKTVMGPRGEAIESYSANPGSLCKTDGTVPSVHGAIHADGSSAKIVEDWQAGFGINLFNPETGESWPQVYRIRDGKALYNGRMIG
ncbi:metallo-phosphoesterase [Microbacterium phage vB_MoxS-ISF9]|uniref:Putative metallophosphatase n=1 Tax=Microbacterium phage vB_MoxS-ISF9 TaxID=1458670 RepID=W8PF67_9CAUD|nr:metallo-phosphoesterase [Microbacterium phage vB_MoxS-ISF9]AHL18501.1 putative metallophosphatase [Microbacterium phage vB_MoxS-ISF9]